MKGKLFEQSTDKKGNTGHTEFSLCIDKKVHVVIAEDWKDELRSLEFISRSGKITIMPCDKTCGNTSILPELDVPPEVIYATEHMIDRVDTPGRQELKATIDFKFNYEIEPYVPQDED